MPGSARNAGLLLFSLFAKRDGTGRDASATYLSSLFSLFSSPFPTITSFSLICPEEQRRRSPPVIHAVDSYTLRAPFVVVHRFHAYTARLNEFFRFAHFFFHAPKDLFGHMRLC